MRSEGDINTELQSIVWNTVHENVVCRVYRYIQNRKIIKHDIYTKSVAQPREEGQAGIRQALSKESTHQADQGENNNLKL